MLWVGGSFAGYNWITQWVGAMAAPRYYASPENRWQELIFDYLPWWMFPTDFPGVTEGFFLGIEKGAGVPWGAWLGPVFWAMSAGAAMTAIGLGLTAVFQKQWVRHERLTYPLAQVPIDLTEGFDRETRLAAVCAAVAFLGGLRDIGRPPVVEPDRILESRVSPPGDFRRLLRSDRPQGCGIIAISAAVFLPHAAHRPGLYVPLRPEYPVQHMVVVDLRTTGPVRHVQGWVLSGSGRAGSQTVHNTRSVHPRRQHGPGGMDPVGRTGTPEEGISAGGPAASVMKSRRPRFCLPGWLCPRYLAGGIYMVFWLNRAGYSATIGLCWLLLFWASILVVMKFLAASGFAYLFPSFGTSILNMTVGANRMSESTLVGLRLVNWRLLAGWRLPAALPHVERLVGRSGRTGWVVAVSLVAGMLAAIVYTVSICYQEGGSTFRTWSLVGAPRGMYEGIAKAVADTDPEVTDPGKIGVWVLGALTAGAIQLMQSRFSWWPLHPLGVMLMSSGYVRLYVLDIFLVWLAKLMVLRFGGISLYRRVKPCCYGLIVGYVFAVGCSFLVDLIWFPEGGHYIHGY